MDRITSTPSEDYMDRNIAKAVLVFPENQGSPSSTQSVENAAEVPQFIPLRTSTTAARAVFDRVQTIRRLHGSSPLKWSELLCAGATYHNFDIHNGGRDRNSEFNFGHSYSEMVLRLDAGSDRRFLSKKKEPFNVATNLMKLWNLSDDWMEIMLDPIKKHCGIAVAMSQTQIYCTSIFSMYEAFMFPPVIEKPDNDGELDRPNLDAVSLFNMQDMGNEFSFHRARRHQVNSERPDDVETSRSCCVSQIRKIFMQTFFPAQYLKGLGRSSRNEELDKGSSRNLWTN